MLINNKRNDRRAGNCLPNAKCAQPGPARISFVIYFCLVFMELFVPLLLCCLYVYAEWALDGPTVRKSRSSKELSLYKTASKQKPARGETTRMRMSASNGQAKTQPSHFLSGGAPAKKKVGKGVNSPFFFLQHCWQKQDSKYTLRKKNFLAPAPEPQFGREASRPQKNPRTKPFKRKKVFRQRATGQKKICGGGAFVTSIFLGRKYEK